MAAAGRALANDDDLRAATSELTLTIEQVVTGAPGVPDGGTVRWQVTIDHGRVALVDRPAGAADHPTAVQIASGELAAQRAFVEGRLRVGGDLSLLTRHQRVFATIDDTLAKVRTETTFD
jgi:hypothetical protein